MAYFENQRSPRNEREIKNLVGLNRNLRGENQRLSELLNTQKYDTRKLNDYATQEKDIAGKKLRMREKDITHLH